MPIYLIINKDEPDRLPEIRYERGDGKSACSMVFGGAMDHISLFCLLDWGNMMTTPAYGTEAMNQPANCAMTGPAGAGRSSHA